MDTNERLHDVYYGHSKTRSSGTVVIHLTNSIIDSFITNQRTQFLTTK